MEIGNLRNISFVKKAIKWLGDAYRKVFKGQKPDESSGLSVVEPSNFQVGHMYLYGYNAKHGKTLPYWDAHPLIIYMGPSRKRPNHFIGLNLHYLPPAVRLNMLKSLDTIHENDKYNDQVKFQASYEYLQGMSIFPQIKVCIKEYIPELIVDRYAMKVEPSHWLDAAAAASQDWRVNSGRPP